jgi:CheY-like chemotaxis protein
VELSRVIDGTMLMEALLLVASTEKLPDLVLLDINMPKMDGIKALELIRNDVSLFEVLVMYSTSNDPGQVKLCYALGANGFRAKAFNPGQVPPFATDVVGFLSGTPGSHFVRFVHKSAPVDFKKRSPLH